MSDSALKPLLVSAGVAAAALALGVASWQADSGGGDAAAPDRGAASASATPGGGGDGRTDHLLALARRDPQDPFAQGRADAPVVLVEYADFRCGYCGKFARDTEPALVKKYVDDGTLRIEWRNYPIFGAESEAAAKAAWAAGRQGRFWQFHAAAYAEGSKEKGFGDARLRELARQAGVPDEARFERDMKSPAAQEALQKDQDEAYGIGVSSTPSFLVGATPIAGAQPAETFRRAVEAARDRARAAAGATPGGTARGAAQ
ncbi:thioredoxin domain-containing protein [Streptomyces sp. NRRL S-87]|uniref:DsbA family protein n=1 Tax=Streptomyces sp. NRRL S-87 TaxID=1463920 RepID=UPI00068AC811|nr:thioredoxin domain-containing protein [Streptomyces sp. NRRL S-87]